MIALVVRSIDTSLRLIASSSVCALAQDQLAEHGDEASTA
jgi:hypothetical protein